MSTRAITALFMSTRAITALFMVFVFASSAFGARSLDQQWWPSPFRTLVSLCTRRGLLHSGSTRYRGPCQAYYLRPSSRACEGLPA
jgi:hypothetical protein